MEMGQGLGEDVRKWSDAVRFEKAYHLTDIVI